MKALKASVVSVFIFLLCLGFSVLYAQKNQEVLPPAAKEFFQIVQEKQESLSPADKELLGKVTVIRITVEETYEKADWVFLPFFEYAEKILKYAGFQAVKEDAKTYDAALHIRAQGIPGGARYLSLFPPGVESWRWTSATVSGVISLSVLDKTFKWSFSGKEGPARSIVDGSHLTANDAPFGRAFDQGFAAVLARLVVRMKDISALLAVLKDEDSRVREAAAYALGEIKDSRGVEPPISALKDENSFVREAAAEALEKVTGERFGEDHAKWQSWWQENKGSSLK